MDAQREAPRAYCSPSDRPGCPSQAFPLTCRSSYHNELTPSKGVIRLPGVGGPYTPLPLVSPCPTNLLAAPSASIKTSHSSRAVSSIRRHASAPSAQPEPSPRSLPSPFQNPPRLLSDPRRKPSWHQSPLPRPWLPTWTNS